MTDLHNILQDETKIIYYDDLIESMQNKISKSIINYQGVDVKFEDIILSSPKESVLNLLTSENIRAILLKNEKLSVGAIAKSELIERKFMHEEKEIGEINEFVKKSETKSFILAGMAGEGKTSAFKYLVRELKKYFIDHWISFIELQKHESILKNSDNVVEIFKKILIIESRLERKIFEDAFNNHKMIFLLDGYDQLKPESKYLTEFLKNEKNMMFWISTGLQCKNQLEHLLQAKILRLKPLTSGEVDLFLRSSESYEKLQNFLQSLGLQNNPFVIQSIADYFAEYNPDPSKTYEIFENIVEIQRLDFLKRNQFDDYEPFTHFPSSKVIQVYALKKLIIRDEFKINNLAVMKMWTRERRKWTSEKIERLGFLSVNLEDPQNEDQSIKFIDAAYADFFIAEYILGYIYNDNIDISKDEIKLIFKLVQFMTKNYRKYEKILKFLINFAENTKEKVGETMEEVIKEYISEIKDDIEKKWIYEFWRKIVLESFEDFEWPPFQKRVLTI